MTKDPAAGARSAQSRAAQGGWLSTRDARPGRRHSVAANQPAAVTPRRHAARCPRACRAGGMQDWPDLTPNLVSTCTAERGRLIANHIPSLTPFIEACSTHPPTLRGQKSRRAAALDTESVPRLAATRVAPSSSSLIVSPFGRGGCDAPCEPPSTHRRPRPATIQRPPFPPLAPAPRRALRF